MKAIVLNRVSTEEQKKDGNSLPAQSARLKKYCDSKGLDVILEESFDESAWKEDRKKFRLIVDKILEAKEPIALCTDKVDRLIRSFSADLVTLEELRKEGRLEMHFVSDNIIIHKHSPAADCFRFTMGVGLAKYYSDSISDNVKRAYESKLKRGEYPGKATFGYKNIDLGDDKNDIVIDPLRAPMAEKIYQMSASGISFRKIKEEMDRLGVTSNTKTPKPLTISAIEHILSNPFFYGIMRFDGELRPHKYQHIISKALFDKVQAVRAGYHKKPFQYGAKPFVFRGLIKCADCGCTITAETTKGRVYYSCTNYKRMHAKRVYIREDELLKPIKELLKNIQLSDEKIKEVTEGLKQINESQQMFNGEAIKALRSEYDVLEGRLVRLTDMRLDNEINADDYKDKLKKIKDRQTDINDQLQKHNDADEDYHITINTVLTLAQRAYDLFESSEVMEKRQLLNFLLQKCELREKKLEYKLKAPFDTMLLVNGCSIGLPGSDSN